MNRNVPNMLSILRILSCGLFLAIGPSPVLAAATVACIALTDILDGYLARKYHCQSELGAQLDSIGDFFFFVSLTAYFCAYHRIAVRENAGVIIAAASMKCIALLIAFARHRRTLFIHTILNKASGMLLVAGMCAVMLFGIRGIVRYVAICILIAGLEEAIIHILGKSPDANTRSLFDAIGKK